jgi:prepilin-type N-terminal cleavage/methylation domain-containing protein
MRHQTRNGFTLVETMVGMAILLIAFISSLTVFEMVQNGQTANESSLGYVAARNQVVSLIIDDTSWAKMIGPPGDATNPNFSCLFKQNSTTASDQDCFGKTDPLVMYNIKGDPYTVNGVRAYDFRSAVQGFSSKGQPCDTFNGNAGSGNFLCPLQLVVTWSAICSASPCINPPILFRGQATFNGGPQQQTPNTNNMSFQIIKSSLYCPPAVTPAGHNTVSIEVDTAAPDRVRSNLNTDVTTTQVGTSNAAMTPCRRVIVSFSEDINSVYAANANNTSSVFIRNEITGADVFEFRRIATGANYDFQLYANGVAVAANKPSWMTLTKLSVYKFDLTNGLLKFCVDDRCVHYFVQKLDFPFRVAFKPASRLFTPGGFNLITYTNLDF